MYFLIFSLLFINTNAQTTEDLSYTQETDDFTTTTYTIDPLHNFHPECNDMTVRLTAPTLPDQPWWAANDFDVYGGQGVAFTHAYVNASGNIIYESPLSDLVWKSWSWRWYHQPHMRVNGIEHGIVNSQIAYLMNFDDRTQWKRIGIRPNVGPGYANTFTADSFDFDANPGDVVTVVCGEFCGKLICDQDCGCNDLTIGFSNASTSPFTYMSCIGSNSCSNITINVDDPNEDAHVDIICKGDNACSYLTIAGDIYESFSLQCIDGTHGSVCDHLYIDIENTKSIHITCEQYGCSDIVVFALDAEVVSAVARGSLAFINSTVYAPNSKQLDVTCFSMLHNGQTCFNLSLHLSSEVDGNTLKCQFGCERMNLYFSNEINMSLFNSISFTECAVCETISDCIDKWMVSYHYNDVEYSGFYYGNVTNYDDELWEFASYINDKYVCPIHPEDMSNSTLFGISFTMFFICILMLFILLICLFKHISMECYYKYKRIRVSKRPSLLVLLYSICNKIIVYIVMVWWAIKMSVFTAVVGEYCGSKYQHSDQIYCGNDDICRYSIHRDTCADRSLGWLAAVVWVVLFVVVWWVSCNICETSCVDYKQSIKQYERRQFWINKKENSESNCDGCLLTGVYVWWYIVVQFIWYGIVTALVLIFVLLYGHYDSDYVIKSYEFYTVLVLILSRIVLELWYTYGRKYDPEHETSKRIHDILNAKFGSDVTYIIEMHLPLYHDPLLCSSDMVISSADVEKFKQQKSIELLFLSEQESNMPFTRRS